ncbi:MAG: NAD-glutamate dehydrogenase [Alphaproteobacteria bacterium]
MSSIGSLSALSTQHISVITEQLGDSGKNPDFQRFVATIAHGIRACDLQAIGVASMANALKDAWDLFSSATTSKPLLQLLPVEPQHHSSFSLRLIAFNDDMPFLVDSLSAALNRLGLEIALLLHPIFAVQRGTSGELMAWNVADQGEGRKESLIIVWLEGLISHELAQQVTDSLQIVFKDVRQAVADWHLMRRLLVELAAESGVVSADAPIAIAEKNSWAEAALFLHWMADHHFTFLGYREYRFHENQETSWFEINHAASLGIMRDQEYRAFESLNDLQMLSPEFYDFIKNRNEVLLVTKTSRRSNIHRQVPMDAIVLRWLDDSGKTIGMRVFIGLFTALAFARMAREIPFVRRKVEAVFQKAGLIPDSHDGRALEHVLNTYPRDELFQITEEHLQEVGLGVIAAQKMRRTGVFFRLDPFNRYLSSMIYLPGERLEQPVRMAIQQKLEQECGGETRQFHVSLSDDSMARLHFITDLGGRVLDATSLQRMEADIIELSRSWRDRLAEALKVAALASPLWGVLQRYGEAFPPSYQQNHHIDDAVADIAIIEKMNPEDGFALAVRRQPENQQKLVVKIFSQRGRQTLSVLLPLLESMGFRIIDEEPYPLTIAGRDEPIWFHEMQAEAKIPVFEDMAKLENRLLQLFCRAWRGDTENDEFNSLVLSAAISWRSVVLLRSFSRFLWQGRFAFSREAMASALARQPVATRLLVKLFHVLHDPSHKIPEEGDLETIKAKLDAQLQQIANPDEDRIIRTFIETILACTRSNFFLKNEEGDLRPYLSFKFESARLSYLPLPRPLYEIFVYSSRFEAVHLRGGRIARGGIRWSDRLEDYRTEVLDLVKAQMVKNAVIVPVGSKGGFALKNSFTDREKLLAEGIACYQMMMRGLLDITDNIVDGLVVHPQNVRIHDGEDPYLVVAADKGTASFSDIANGISAEYGFWLGDAFASGGSSGYDHKKMAITARGGWECVKRHFREIGTDIQTTPFSVIGVGDMSGDVFGNGMLLSPAIRLLAAFDHRHIFIDPQPDIQASFAERARIFALPRSSWDDYDRSLIAEGGGVFSRALKEIPLSPAIQKMLNTEATALSPAALMRALLLQPVDLLWFGGIGTYVKSSEETHADAMDKANDAIRVDGAELRAKVIGEGANLGVTQRGRVEFARHGGRLNTDFIDNSAGVASSDIEVNLKILCNLLMRAGKFDLAARDVLLASMSDEVAALVLRHNYWQGQAISLTEAQGVGALDSLIDVMRFLEKRHILNRRLEKLPDAQALEERRRQQQGLTRPEISLLLSYVKIFVYQELLQNPAILHHPLIKLQMQEYFPQKIIRDYQEFIHQHPLYQEIAATFVTNLMVNYGGITFVTQMLGRTGASVADIALAFVKTVQAFRLPLFWQAIEHLDSRLNTKTQYGLMASIVPFLQQAVMWVLSSLAENESLATDGITQMQQELINFIPAAEQKILKERQQILLEAGLPADIAQPMASIDYWINLMEISHLSAEYPAHQVMKAYVAMGGFIEADYIQRLAREVPPLDSWHRQAIYAVVEGVYQVQSQLTAEWLKLNDSVLLDETWLGSRKPHDFARFRQMLAEFKTLEKIDLVKLQLLLSALRQAV